MAIQHLKKLISLFYKNYFNKPAAIFKIINTASLMARPTIKPMALKQKYGQPARLIIRPTALKQKQDRSAKPTIKPTALKQKQGQLPRNNTNKQAKKN